MSVSKLDFSRAQGHLRTIKLCYEKMAISELFSYICKHFLGFDSKLYKISPYTNTKESAHTQT